MAVVSQHPPLDYRTLVEQLPVVTYTVDFKDPKTVTYVSPQVASVMGYTPAEYRENRQIWPDRIDGRDRPAVLDALERIQTTGEPLICDYRFRHQDGRVLWIHDEATVVRDATGRPAAMQGIMQDVTDRRRGEEMRAHLIARAISAQEEERTRIARELHDETGQALSAILIGLRSIEEAPDVERVRRLSERLRAVTAHAIKDVGRIARGLRPSTLDDLGLVPALQRYCDELRTALGIDVTIGGDVAERLPREIETTVYRIVQEALTNVARHAAARTAEVHIERRNGTVRVTIRDDGRGFDVAATMHHEGRQPALGLVGMRERASLVGGTVAFQARASGGATIVVDLPVGAA